MVWLSPLLVLMGALHLSGLPSESDQYAVRAWSEGLSVVFLVGPVAAGCAAWSVGRLHRAGVFTSTRRRPSEVVVLDAVWPTLLLAGAVLVGLGVIRAGVSLPPAAPLLAVFCALLGLVAAGAIAGMLLPLPVALPLTLVTGYMWMVFPQASEPLWLRHLTGFWLSCCSVDTVPSWRATLGVASLSLGVLASLVLVLRLHRPAVRSLAVLPTVAGLAVAVLAVHPLGPDPVASRGTAPACSTPAPGVTLCLWPEHEPARRQAEDVLVAAVTAWQDQGLDVPARFVEGKATEGAVPVWFPPSATRENMRTTLAEALLPPTPRCAAHEPYPAGGARPLAAAWLSVVAGTPLERIGDTSPDLASSLRQLRALSPTAQRDWYRDVRRALSTCGITPPVEVTG